MDNKTPMVPTDAAQGLQPPIDNAFVAPGCEKFTWTLIAPDGREFRGDSPMRCARAELDSRIPPEVQMARIWAAVDEDEALDRMALAALQSLLSVASWQETEDIQGFERAAAAAKDVLRKAESLGRVFP